MFCITLHHVKSAPAVFNLLQSILSPFLALGTDAGKLRAFGLAASRLNLSDFA